MSMSTIDSQEPAYVMEHEIVVQTKRLAKLQANQDTRWFELFGTPEKAARTLTEYFIEGCDGVACADGCPFYDSTSYMDCRVTECNNDALLGWLRGKAVKR